MPTYKEQQILDKVCKLTRQKQINYYDFIPFFDFQYEKLIFNCQPSHFSPCSAVPVNGPSPIHDTSTWLSQSIQSIRHVCWRLGMQKKLPCKCFRTAVGHYDKCFPASLTHAQTLPLAVPVSYFLPTGKLMPFLFLLMQISCQLAFSILSPYLT